jgi:hypothetical protein
MVSDSNDSTVSLLCLPSTHKNVSLEDAVIEAEQWMEENSSSNAFMDNWKPNTDVKKGRLYDKKGIYKVSYRCRYRDLCDCTCCFRLWHDQETNVLEVQWYVTGNAHGSTSATQRPFALFEAHKDFQHIRLPPKPGCTNVMLPIEMMEVIEDIVQNYDGIRPLALHSKLRSYTCNGKPVRDYPPEQWSSMVSKIDSYVKTTQKFIKDTQGALLGDTLRGLQEWAIKNTYDEVVQREKNDFNIYSMFVAAYEFEADNTLPPLDKRKQKEWKPKHRGRIVLTCIAMSMFTPAIACRGDVFGRLIFSHDFTYKLFFARAFRLGGLYVSDATLSAKLIGYEVTCNENAGDVYVTARACRNVTQHICSLKSSELPGGITQLPFNLPSPVPPFTKDKPLRFNKEERLYEQQSDESFLMIETPRYCSKESN